MICFQLFLWQFLFQRNSKMPLDKSCCDLLSIVPLTIFVSAIRSDSFTFHVLWFAFNCSFDNFCFSIPFLATGGTMVVICFQLFLWQFLFQLSDFMLPTCISCDLLSIVPLTIFVSAALHVMKLSFPLWFAFNCSFDNFCFSENAYGQCVRNVVICFQLFLWQFLFQRKFKRS